MQNDHNLKKLSNELKKLSDELRCLINSVSPKKLIGLLWWLRNQNNDFPVEIFQLLMEYIHTTLALDGVINKKNANLDCVLGKILNKTCLLYEKCLEVIQEFPLSMFPLLAIESKNLYLQKWLFFRQKRFFILEEEFLSYVLKYHNDILEKTYNITSDCLAQEFQKFYKNLAFGLRKMNISLENIHLECDSIGDLFNLSKNTNLPPSLLSDLAYEPENKNIFDSEDYGLLSAGTPFRTIPAKIKPLIKLDEDFYCTDPTLIRDTLYRAIQRAIITHDPDYKKNWNIFQNKMSEDAFVDLMSNHLKGAKIFKNVYYRTKGGNWNETDCVIILDDILINIEVKAAAETLGPPIENFNDHVKRINDLIEHPYHQSERFIEYLYTQDESPIFKKNDNCRNNCKYQEIYKISTKNLRKIFPIGLTIETFDPFSSLIKTKISNIQGIHDFISISIDDLMVIRHILNSTGEFIHYLEFRQKISSIKELLTYDEKDHLGIYLKDIELNDFSEMVKNKKDNKILLMFKEPDKILKEYFSNVKYPNIDRPSRKYPKYVAQLLCALEKKQESQWLDADAFIRSLRKEERYSLSNYIQKCLKKLSKKQIPSGFFQYNDIYLLFVKNDIENIQIPDLLARDTISALGQKKIRLFKICFNKKSQIYSAQMCWFENLNFSLLQIEAKS